MSRSYPMNVQFITFTPAFVLPPSWKTDVLNPAPVNVTPGHPRTADWPSPSPRSRSYTSWEDTEHVVGRTAEAALRRSHMFHLNQKCEAPRIARRLALDDVDRTRHGRTPFTIPCNCCVPPHVPPHHPSYVVLMPSQRSMVRIVKRHPLARQRQRWVLTVEQPMQRGMIREVPSANVQRCSSVAWSP
jgi:hypothetical protein